MSAHTKPQLLASGSARLGWATALLALTVAACSSSSSTPAPTPAPTLQSVAIGAGSGKAYAAVGIPQQLSVVGKYSDGTSAALTSGVTWSSSDETIASIDDNGRISPWRKGDGVVITAKHQSSGLTATTTLSAREVIRFALGSGPLVATVDTTETYFRVTGLQPGTLYTPELTAMTDDVDLEVYGDMSMAKASELCVSDKIGRYDESCVAPASGSGELWIRVGGQWTNAGAKFSLDVTAAQPVTLAATLAFPTQFAHPGSIGPTTELFKVTGLTAGTSYEVRISHLSADIDLQVFGDVFEYEFLCASYKLGTVDDFCTAKATTAGELFVAILGETTIGGGTYALSLAAK